MLANVLTYLQLIVSVVLVVIILVQQKGAGLGAGFGGPGGPVVTTRRGVDLFLHKLTIATSIIFFALAIVNFFM